ncbi:MAG: polysaccharide deacetylase family protein [Gemmatimonadota bacterium]
MRQAAKAGLEAFLARSGAARAFGGSRRGEVLILAYHNIRGDDATPSGDRSLHLPLRSFRGQLDRLTGNHDVIPLTEVFDAPRSDRPRVAITFDDAYVGAVTLGIPELVSRGLPATIFVAPHFLGGQSFWWDAIADSEGLTEPVRMRALEELRGEDRRIRDWATANHRTIVEPALDSRCVSEAVLTDVASAPGITLGSHTWSHPNLARLDGAELAEEFTRPLAWLKERFTSVVPWVSYPYGRWSPLVATAAQAAGYRAGLRVDGGWYRPGRDADFAIPRLNVPAGLSADGFALRLAGLFCQ